MPKLRPIAKPGLVGNEAENDVSVRWTGEKTRSAVQSPAQTVQEKRPKAKKKRSRLSRQRKFTIRKPEQLKELAAEMGITDAAVVNLALASLAKEWL